MRVRARVIVAVTFAALGGCRGGERAEIARSDAAAQPEAATGDRTIPLEQVLLPQSSDGSFAGWGETPFYAGLLAVPGPAEDLGVVLQPSRPRANQMWAPGLEFVGFGRPSARISKDVGGQYSLQAFAVGRTAPGSELPARVVPARVMTVLAGSRMPTGGFDSFVPWTMPGGVALQSWPLAPSRMPVKSVELDVGIGLGASCFAIGDADADGDDDFCLLDGAKRRCVVVSGRELALIGAFSFGSRIDRVACVLDDRDGKGVSRIFALLEMESIDAEDRVVHGPDAPYQRESWCVISPAEGVARVGGRLRHSTESAPRVNAATGAGRTAEGHARVALLARLGTGRSLLRTLDVETGVVLESANLTHAASLGPGALTGGALPGGAGKRWIAWTLASDERSPRLFVAEIGGVKSPIELLLPETDRQRWAERMCPVRISADGDQLAITLAVPEADAGSPEFRPVRIVDVAHCLAQR